MARRVEWITVRGVRWPTIDAITRGDEPDDLLRVLKALVRLGKDEREEVFSEMKSQHEKIQVAEVRDWTRDYPE